MLHYVAPNSVTLKKGLEKLSAKQVAPPECEWQQSDSKLIENSDVFDIHFKGFMLLSIIVALA